MNRLDYFITYRSMTGKIIVVEGVDATWKSTLASSLAAECGAVYYKTPWGVTLEQRARFDNPYVPVSERYHFYLEACRKDIESILDMTQWGSHVVCDRFLSSTIAHHRAMDDTLDTTEAEGLNLATPKIQILLIASHATILWRLAWRSEVTRLEKNSELAIRTQEIFRSQINDLIISTDSYNQDEVLRQAYSFLLSKI